MDHNLVGLFIASAGLFTGAGIGMYLEFKRDSPQAKRCREYIDKHPTSAEIYKRLVNEHKSTPNDQTKVPGDNANQSEKAPKLNAG